LKDALRAPSALFSQSTPTRLAHSFRSIAHDAVADEVDIDVLIGRPMALEVVEESGPT